MLRHHKLRRHQSQQRFLRHKNGLRHHDGQLPGTQVGKAQRVPGVLDKYHEWERGSQLNLYVQVFMLEKTLILKQRSQRQSHGAELQVIGPLPRSGSKGRREVELHATRNHLQEKNGRDGDRRGQEVIVPGGLPKNANGLHDEINK